MQFAGFWDLTNDLRITEASNESTSQLKTHGQYSHTLNIQMNVFILLCFYKNAHITII